MKFPWKWSLLMVGVATVGIVGMAYAPFDRSQEVASNPLPVAEQADATQQSSVWDQNIQPYTGNAELVVYRSPTCGCCGEWIQHMERHGFKVKEDVKTDEMEALKAEYGVPAELASCHTAIIDGYVVEGHIPADDVKALLAQKPDIIGIAVPGMPLGSPGMEAGERKQDFAVVAFKESPEVDVFQEHQAY
jgi:hypothetical protein